MRIIAAALFVLAAVIGIGSFTADAQTAQAHCCCTAISAHCPTPSPAPTPTTSPTPTPTPTPTPSPTPTPTPTPGPIVVMPSPLPAFVAFGQQQTVSVSEQWFSGTFTYTGCATPSPVATIAPASGAGPAASFNVTALANGTCAITVTGFTTASVPVTVSTPTPPATPTPSPSPTATPGGVYTFPGSSGIQVYNSAAASPDPIINANIATTGLDANSATVMANTSPQILFPSTSDASLEIVNIATHLTPFLHVGTVGGGHNPPISKGAFGGGTGAMVPWQGGVFKFEGTHTTSCTGDCHWVVVDNDPTALDYGYVYEGGGGNWTSGGGFVTYDGLVDNLAAAYPNQGTPWYQNKVTNWSVAGIPGLATTAYGDDATLTALNHPIQLIVPVSTLLSGSNGVNYATGAGNGGGTCGDATKCFKLGDIVRIKAADCNGQTGQILLVCNALLNQGGVVADTGSTPQFRFGLNIAGTDPWTHALFVWIHGLTMQNDFDLLSRTALVP